MSKTILMISYIFILLNFTSCSNKNIVKTTSHKTNAISNNLLINCWSHSREEEAKDKHSENIYRPCDYMEFPLSRFRANLTLNSDHTARYLILAQNDGHYLEDGTWSYDDSTNELKVYNPNQKIVKHVRIIKCTKDKLIISRIK